MFRVGKVNNVKNIEYYKNTIILFLGKFSTQFISFLLLPLFTRYLTTSDYGYVDLLQTYISLLMPICLLRIDSAAFRFLVDERKNEKKQSQIISISLALGVVASIILILLYIILRKIINIKYVFSLVISVIILIFINIVLQIVRGLGKNYLYSITAIVVGVINCIINIILIIVFKWNAESILISNIISNFLGLIFISIKLNILKKIIWNYKNIDKSLISEMIKYSIPMIPNSFSWWIVNVSDRSIISLLIGISYNGIYTISCKFSNILNNIFSVFNMSWTESASIHIKDKDKNEYFDEMINKLFFGFASIGMLIISMLPLIYDSIVGTNYRNSYNYIPILIIAGTIDVLAWLCGGIYIACKETKKVAKTTIISAILNIIIHLSLIKFIGLYAACISTLLSYLYLSIFRYYDCQKYVQFKINCKFLTIMILSYIVCVILYYTNILVLNIINFAISTFVLIIINRQVIIELITMVKGKLVNEKRVNKKN